MSSWLRTEPEEVRFPHVCAAYHNSADDLENVVPGSNLDVRMQRRLKKRFLVNEKNRRIFGYLRSNEAVRRCKNRHLTKHFYMIHPLSDVRKFWEIFMIFVLMVSLLSTPIILISRINSKYWTMALFFTDLLCMVDVGLNFSTGVLLTDIGDIEMRLKAVAWLYLKKMFIFDMLGALPADFVDTQLGALFGFKTFFYPPWYPLRLIKLTRIARFMIYFRNVIQIYNLSFLKARCLTLVVVLSYIFHVMACARYYVTINTNGDYSLEADPGSWMTTLDVNSVLLMYVQSLFSVARTMFGVCLVVDHESISEQNLEFILLLLGQIIFYVLIVNVILITIIQHSSIAKYQGMTRQLSRFFVDKSLPPNLQQKVLSYYDFRFQKSYFSEPEIMDTLTEQLKQDVIAHHCRRLVDAVSFFNPLPDALKIRFMSRMRKTYCLVDDVIIRADEPTQTMYFIKFGTLAVYSPGGSEICHLEDGQHFGELSLILEKQVKRAGMIVVIENSLVYSLDRTEFLNALVPYPEVLARLKRVAKNRLEKTRGKENVIEGV